MNLQWIGPLIVLGLVLLVVNFIPMAANIKRIINIVGAIIAALYVLQVVFGINLGIHT
jgi:lipopolysaccharide export LptBFGC system permease protein LptF